MILYSIICVYIDAISRFLPSQSFNLIGMKSFFSALRNPSLFLPHETYNHVTEINLLNLKKSGIKGLIFDKDNTLTEPYRNEVPQRINSFLRVAMKVIFMNCRDHPTELGVRWKCCNPFKLCWISWWSWECRGIEVGRKIRRHSYYSTSSKKARLYSRGMITQRTSNFCRYLITFLIEFLRRTSV